MENSWLVAAAVCAVGAIYFIAGRPKRRPTQHDLDPTLKKNQIRITTQKKAFRREDLPAEYLASLQRRDIVEIPLGAARPELPAASSIPENSESGKDTQWLPENLTSKKKPHKKLVK